MASDFGIVSLTPLNHNVFQEIGLMQGLQKSLLYILNPDRKEKLPFDISDQIYVEHNNARSLVEGLGKKIPLFIEKVRLLSGFEREKKELIDSKIKMLSKDAKNVLKRMVLEGSSLYTSGSKYGIQELVQNLNLNVACIKELRNHRFIVQEAMSGGSKTIHYEKLNESYGKYLEELLWL